MEVRTRETTIKKGGKLNKKKQTCFSKGVDEEKRETKMDF